MTDDLVFYEPAPDENERNAAECERANAYFRSGPQKIYMAVVGQEFAQWLEVESLLAGGPGELPKDLG